MKQALATGPHSTHTATSCKDEVGAGEMDRSIPRICGRDGKSGGRDRVDEQRWKNFGEETRKSQMREAMVTAAIKRDSEKALIVGMASTGQTAHSTDVAIYDIREVQEQIAGGNITFVGTTQRTTDYQGSVISSKGLRNDTPAMPEQTDISGTSVPNARNDRQSQDQVWIAEASSGSCSTTTEGGILDDKTAMARGNTETRETWTPDKDIDEVPGRWSNGRTICEPAGFDRGSSMPSMGLRAEQDMYEEDILTQGRNIDEYWPSASFATHSPSIYTTRIWDNPQPGIVTRPPAARRHTRKDGTRFDDLEAARSDLHEGHKIQTTRVTRERAISMAATTQLDGGWVTMFMAAPAILMQMPNQSHSGAVDIAFIGSVVGLVFAMPWNNARMETLTGVIILCLAWLSNMVVFITFQFANTDIVAHNFNDDGYTRKGYGTLAIHAVGRKAVAKGARKVIPQRFSQSSYSVRLRRETVAEFAAQVTSHVSPARTRKAPIGPRVLQRNRYSARGVNWKAAGKGLKKAVGIDIKVLPALASRELEDKPNSWLAKSTRN
ncbi:uncharacterized protein FIBRA_01880 [Fibroporia radiculosa]|uniref:Uncharacterized protein n=1 Tax=Fibroporia radiculosa TaxID=599839 RepID=J4I8R2_9APHY|nr:uncharacterized protein FIBRA_01880 [Fibroporia radiculosa]CCL99856.1 predicted protein [Fibroporia radiculosa]